jgi:hypothetical protein
VYLDVPYSGHANVINLINNEDTTNKTLGIQAEYRKAVFIEALRRPLDTQTDKNQFFTRLEQDKTVDDVVFVIHGIRDLGYWTSKIARKIYDKSKTGDQRNVITETSSYGYFPMLSFLIPGKRQEKVQWLMDRYTEAKARYPQAKFHYIGHSHGTYLLAKALEDYPSVSFENVVFAGSVVRQHYEWDKYIAQNRIAGVQNFVATADWVVGIFPKALQTLGIQDMGSAGHDGFDKATELEEVYQPEKFVTGGHSAALQEDMWNSIADFILDGKITDPPPTLLSSSQSFSIKALSYLAPLILFGIIALVLYGLIWLIRLDTEVVQEWKKTLIIVGYLGFIWLVITRV